MTGIGGRGQLAACTCGASPAAGGGMSSAHLDWCPVMIALRLPPVLAVAATTAGLLERQFWWCLRCGGGVAGTRASRHHRVRRGPGDDSPPNVILLCGTGTTGCHGRAHHYKQEAMEHGWVVPTWAAPADIPVWSYWHSQFAPSPWIMLGADYEAAPAATTPGELLWPNAAR